MKNKPKLLVIVGPTASGKSDLAVDLAKEFNGEIISADSRQVYRGMDIGTGKVTEREKRHIPHFLLDVASPKQTYAVTRFQREAGLAIKDITRRGKLPILCGGTGFYIQAVVDGMIFPAVKPNQKLRKELRKKSVLELSSILQKLDKRRWQEIDKHNPHRLIRAIEIATALGKVPKLSSEGQVIKPIFDLLEIGIKTEPETLKERIHRRLIKRLRAGMLAEVKKLHDTGVSWQRLESFGLEYKWLAKFLQKKISKSEMIIGLGADINNYAKRQLTWFKRDSRIRWIRNSAEAVVETKGWLKS